MGELREGRARRADGRPEQTRPRDRTGRPLSEASSDVLTTVTLTPHGTEEAVRLGAGRWAEQRYFEAHELLEHAWKAAAGPDRELWKGVIQVAVAGVHLQRGNRHGAIALLQRALERLGTAPAHWQGLDVDGLRVRAAALLRRLENGELPDADLGELLL